jgi:hypothetical protein
MAKVVSIRERVHQPFWDTLIRTPGYSQGTVGDTTDLFGGSGTVRTPATTNLQNGSTLPSDQSHVVLALRVFSWYRNSILRVAGVDGELALNGDYGNLALWTGSGAAVGQAPGQIEDVFRLHWQTEEQLHWSFGTGEKFSITNMPTWYFPTGGGLSAQLGGATDLIHMQNSGTDGHSGILRLARAILIPPRQNIKCTANIYALPGDPNTNIAGTSQGQRSLLSLRDNLNAIDAINKVVTFTFDGLFSRDVQ